MSDRVKMFEMFTSLEDFIGKTGDVEHAEILDDTIALYTKMQEDLEHRDSTIVHKVLDMQMHCSSWLLSLKEKIKGLHVSVESHVEGYGDQIMALQVQTCYAVCITCCLKGKRKADNFVDGTSAA